MSAGTRTRVRPRARAAGAGATQAPTGTGSFVYAVVPAASAAAGAAGGSQAEVLERLSGVDEAPLRLVEVGEVAAVVSTAGLDRTGSARADLMAYSTVLEQLTAAGPVAPVQFGSLLLDDVAVAEELLAPDADRLTEVLADLEGRCQLNLSASYVEEVVLGEVVAADPEVRRLRERTRGLPEDQAYADRVRLGELVARAVEQRREQDADMVLDEVLPHVAAYSLRPAGGLDRVLDAALLVEQDRRAALEEHLETLAEAWHDRLRLRLVGPVAAYDFVGGT